MSRLTSLIHLMDDPAYDGLTHFLVNNNYVVAGSNSSNNLFYLTFSEEGWNTRRFVTHEQAHGLIFEVTECLD